VGFLKLQELHNEGQNGMPGFANNASNAGRQEREEIVSETGKGYAEQLERAPPLGRGNASHLAEQQRDKIVQEIVSAFKPRRRLLLS